MNFKPYDILSTLVPGFLGIFVLLYVTNTKYDNNLLIPYTAYAFLVGYLLNTISSWLEDFYFITWGGKPSVNILEGKSIWKVQYHYSSEVRELLQTEIDDKKASNQKLFALAMKMTTGLKDCRIEDFNTTYAFSRVILTTVLLSTILLIINNPYQYKTYAFTLPILLAVWLRAKQRAYYYVREVLNEYFKLKKAQKKKEE